MKPIQHTGDFRPNPQQELLLREAVSKDQTALKAWEKWKSIADMDHIDAGSYRLLPLVYRNLGRNGIRDPLMGKLKGIYRKSWYRNQTLFHHVAGIIRAFHGASMQTMVLKGAALTLLYYRDFGVRPMADFDVLVHTHQARAAIDRLRQLGFSSVERTDSELSQLHVYDAHSNGFTDEAGADVDLHWHVLLESLEPDADDDFWEAAVPLLLGDVPTHALNPTDTLLHVCVHGFRRSSISPIRWVADAMTIINTSQGMIDWDRLANQARKRGVSLRLAATLRYLRSTFAVPIPSECLHGIEGARTTLEEHFEYARRMGFLVGSLGTPTGSAMLQHLRRYSQYTQSHGFLRRIVGFPRYLQYVWRRDHLWQVPLHAIPRLVRKIRRDGAA